METTFYNSWLFYGVLTSIPLIYWYLTRNFNYWSKRGINGPKPILGFGTILTQFITPKPTLELDWMKKYGKIYGLYAGNAPVLTVGDPKLLKDIMVRDFHIFTDRTKERRNHPILSKHLVAEKGEDWKRIRSIVSPTFTSGKMKKMYPMVKQCLNEFLDELESIAKNKQEMNVKDMYGNYTMDVIATCAFATKTNSHKDKDNPFIKNVIKVFNQKWYRLLPSLLFPKFLLKFLGIKSGVDESANKFFFDITRHILKERKNSNKNYNDFVQLLLTAQKNNNNDIIRDENDVNEAHYVNEGEEELAIERKTLKDVDKYLTEDEILANSWVFFIAGYETTATLLTFTTYRLALNPEVQERLYEEVLTAFDSNGEINYDLLAKLPYLDAVVSETLRIDSPVLRLARNASTDYKLGDTGLTVPKGQTIEIPIFAMHHSDEFYEKPFEYNPDRFLPENRHKIIPYSYLPFGAGPRNCIGMRFALMEAKLALVHIVKRYRFFRSEQTDVPLVLKTSLVLHSPKRVLVGIEKRK